MSDFYIDVISRRTELLPVVELWKCCSMWATASQTHTDTHKRTCTTKKQIRFDKINLKCCKAFPPKER